MIPLRLDRRRFIEGLGLGASATLVEAMAGSLFSYAYGQPSRQKVVLFATGAPFVGRPDNQTAALAPEHKYIPPEVGKTTLSSPQAAVDYTWPAMLKPLEPYRRQMALLEGMDNNRAAAGHGLNYGALSNVTPLSGGRCSGGCNGYDSPGGITIDQRLAQGPLGGGVPHRSILFGVSSKGAGNYQGAGDDWTFAAGPRMAVRNVKDPAELAARVFGAKTGAALAGAPAAPPGARRALVLGSIRRDVERLRARLAGPERARLDGYLALVADLERRQLAPAFDAARCEAPPAAPAAGAVAPEVALESMMAMATVALTCGVTNVIGISVGMNGLGHGSLPAYTNIPGGTNRDHDADFGPRMRHVHALHASLIADMVSRLSGTPGRAPPDLTVVYIPDRDLIGPDHHAKAASCWPAVILSGNPALRTGGRFLALGRARKLGTMFCSLGHAVGDPMDQFGTSTGGPMGEILA